MELADFEFVMAVHLMGSVHCTRAVWEPMREQKYGRIVLTTSSSGLYGNFGQSNYGAAKMALIGFMNTLRLEGLKYQLRINAIAPTAATRMTYELFPQAIHPMLEPRLVTPGVLFLCSEGAPNGEILTAGAGCFARARIVESRGVFLGADVTPEQVAEHWESEIFDPVTARAYRSGSEQPANFASLVAAAATRLAGGSSGGSE
jgi:hypothetical protein